MKIKSAIFALVLVVSVLLGGCSIQSVEELRDYLDEREAASSTDTESSESSESSASSRENGPMMIRPDIVEVMWVDVDDDAQTDIKTVVGVRYILESEERAYIQLGVNIDEPDSFTMFLDVQQEIRKGEGEYEFTIYLDKQPESWPNGSPFSIVAAMSRIDDLGIITSSKLDLIEDNVVPEKEVSESTSEAESALEELSVFYFIEENSIYLGEEIEFKPVIALYVDGTFAMHVNLFEGMSYLSGTYLIDGDTIDFSVKKIDFKGFTGDDVKSFRMILNGNTLKMIDDIMIGVTRLNSEFFLTNGKPAHFQPETDSEQ